MVVDYVSCKSADWAGRREDGKFCAGPGLVYEGAQLCDEPLPTKYTGAAISC